MGRALAVANPWAPRIQAALRKSIEGILEAGRLLSRARADLPKADYEMMLQRDLGLGLRSAQMLMKIAADQRVAKYISRLPSNWSTLHHLTRLNDRQFDAAVRDGTIRPTLTQKEAGGLAYKTKQVARLTRAQSQNVGRNVSLWLCDPPWRPESFDPPYRTLPIAKIRNLRLGPDGRASQDHAHPTVAQASAPCAAIGLWAIDEYLHEAEHILGSWGFEYIGPRIIWNKVTRGNIGRSSLCAHEYLLIGVRGGAVATWKPQSVITIPRAGLRDSEKPVEFHQIVQKMFPLLVERCELFARRATPGWNGWGDQYPGNAKSIA